MPNSTNFSAKTAGAHVTGTLTDHLPVNPNIPPTGLQAIGPRVTFNFITDAWSDENSYQYYDVVQVSGNSYIARQNVPTGIDISDTDYWIHWADPNAQFQELLNTVQTFDGRITENTNDIVNKAPTEHSSSETTYGVGSGTVYGHVKLTDEISDSDVSSGVALTPKAVYTYSEKTLLVIGDSFSDENFTANPNWAALVANKFNFNLVNKAVSGSGYLTGTTFYSQIVDAVSEISDKTKVKYVVLYGSINDLNHISGSNLYQAAVQCINALKQNFPQAKVIVASPTRYNGTIDVFKDMLRQLQFAAYNVGGAIFANALSWLRNNAVYIDSTLHPTATGQLVLSSFFSSLIDGGNSVRDEYYANASFTNATFDGICFVQGNIGIINFKVDHSTNYGTNQWTQIGVLYNSCFNGNTYFPVYDEDGNMIGKGHMSGNYDVNNDTCTLSVYLDTDSSILQFSTAYIA